MRSRMDITDFLAWGCMVSSFYFGKELGLEFKHGRERFGNGNLPLDLLIARGEFDQGVGQVSRADGEADRRADEVRLRKDDACTDRAVVNHGLHTRFAQGVVEFFANALRLLVIRAEHADLRFPRGDGDRPDGAVLVVALLTDGSA